MATDLVLFDPDSTTDAGLTFPGMPTDSGVTTYDGPHRSKEEREVLDRVFGGNYRTTGSECVIVSPDLSLQRQSGNLVPRLSQVANGAFTTPHAREKLALIINDECRDDLSVPSTATLAVFAGETITARAITPGVWIGGVFDLDPFREKRLPDTFWTYELTSGVLAERDTHATSL